MLLLWHGGFSPPHEDRAVLFARALLFALAALSAAPAAAETVTGQIEVSLTVLPTCGVRAGALAFGALESGTPAANAEAPVTLDCTPGTPYTVTLDEGRNGARRLAAADGTGFVPYEIYQDAAATRRWGGSTGGAISGVAPDDGRVSLSAHGRILAAATEPGRYEDVVTVMVQF